MTTATLPQKMAAAELLHNSKENYGLSGIVESPEEENIFEKLSNENFNEDSIPTVWWMNFRIEKYDTFEVSIRKLVKKGGNVNLILNHPNNPNIPFRLKETYPNKSLSDYIEHFNIQARTFIKLEEESINNNYSGKLQLFFNKESSCYPIFIVQQGLRYKVFSGFYLNNLSGSLPYIIWETSGSGMVHKFRNYINFKMESSMSSSEVRKELGFNESNM